ncbi:TPA: hypothetical protein SI321_003049 [Escherichia coli]|uniref:hypothetical protein n=1 Tax=Escherichia TaxID=561 RepID=UPI000DA5C4B1|nr:MULTISPECIES: hypothetical protein [Escherichia]HBT9067243.1 hypothetical protein [Klebsiella pneumoniae]EEX2836215.1 hypothetical protein [Escherichia albertii]EFB1110563.1 hypothetical protein [Escherichia coli]EFF4887931.1 hypothetical protein [Escherichia coli]EFF4953005.1 hypothetical protein [Escherichia coli]
MAGQLTEKLKTFNWKDDRLRMWPGCKFGVQITACCISVSFFMTICAALVYGESAMGLLVCFLVVHFFSAIITIVVLWEISSTQYVLMKIAPETDIISKSEQLKKRCVLYASRVALIIIAVAVGFELQFVLFSGAVFALLGAIFTCVFSYKVRKLYPDDFVRFVYVNLPGESRSKDDVCCSSSNEVNPATGLLMLDDTIDVGGNAWGMNNHCWDDRW